MSVVSVDEAGDRGVQRDEVSVNAAPDLSRKGRRVPPGAPKG